jgi:hypothetical protein
MRAAALARGVGAIALLCTAPAIELLQPLNRRHR